jgi:uracil-DNA glycosylase family 4
MIPLTSYCEDCPRKYSPIPGDGPQPAEILTVGERPGQNENKYHRVFIGKTGEEWNQTYLPLAGLFRDDVRVCNAVRCWADNNRTPTDREISCCARHHLPNELERTRPRIVILMGGSACKLVPTIRLDTHHGFPQWGRLFDWEGWIVPMYHPALGLHESRWMTQILEDWERLGELLRTGNLDIGLKEYETSPGVFRSAPTPVRAVSSWPETKRASGTYRSGRGSHRQNGFSTTRRMTWIFWPASV